MDKFKAFFGRYFGTGLTHLFRPEMVLMLGIAISVLATDTKLLLSIPIAIAVAVLAAAVAFWLAAVIFEEIEKKNDANKLVDSSVVVPPAHLLWARTVTFIALVIVIVFWLK